MTSRVVIVGASLAGLRTAETLRAKGFTGTITLCGAEPYAPYNRPPLSKDVLRGETDLEALTFRPSRALDPIEWRLGTAAVSVDTDRRLVGFDDGSSVEYDALVIATGVRSRELPVHAGHDSMLRLRSIEDAHALRERLRPGRSLLIIGSGFIGCEVAASARKVGVDVSLVTMETAPLALAIGPELADALYRRHLDHDVRFFLDDGVAEISATDGTVSFRSGAAVRADVILEAVGSVPNTDWLAGSPLDITDGVLVDHRLAAVGAEGVYAVGDVARFPNARFDDVARRVEHWNVAVETGRRVASAIVADLNGSPLQEPFRMMPTFWSNQYDLRLQSYGMPRLADSIRPFDEELGGAPIMGYYRGDDLVAVAALTNGPRLLELASSIGSDASVAAA